MPHLHSHLVVLHQAGNAKDAFLPFHLFDHFSFQEVVVCIPLACLKTGGGGAALPRLHFNLHLNSRGQAQFLQAGNYPAQHKRAQ